MIRSSLVVVCFLLVSFFASAQASLPPSRSLEVHKLVADSTFLGMRFGNADRNATGPVPFDREYEQLTVVQKQNVMSSYENMGEGDEPPFPLGGLAKLYEPITRAQPRLVSEGRFFANVLVDPRGEATEIKVLESPGPKVSQFIGSIALLTKYKPALCKGLPCSMEFPIRVNFKIE